MARYKRGETPKLNKEVIASLASAIREGVPVERAAVDCGITKDTLYRWLHSNEGRYSAPLVRDFQKAVSDAMEEARLRNLGLLKVPPRTSH